MNDLTVWWNLYSRPCLGHTSASDGLRQVLGPWMNSPLHRGIHLDLGLLRKHEGSRSRSKICIITEASEQCSSEQITLGPGEIWNHSSGRLMAQHCPRRPGNKEWVYWWRTVFSGATFYLVHIFLHSTSRQSPRQKLRAILKQFNWRKFSQEREPAKDSGTLASNNCRKALPPLSLKDQEQKKNVFISYGCYNELPQTWCLKTTDFFSQFWNPEVWNQFH